MDRNLESARNGKESDSECQKKDGDYSGTDKKVEAARPANCQGGKGLWSARGEEMCYSHYAYRVCCRSSKNLVLIGSAVGVLSLTNGKEIALMAAVKRRSVAPHRFISSGSLASERPSLKNTKPQPTGTAIVS